MFQLVNYLFSRMLQPVIKPVVRFFLGFVAIPLFRVILRKVARVQDINPELEKDLEQWFRGSLLLLVATRNMEGYLFAGWVSNEVLLSPYFMAGRLLLAIGVIEGMPDQSLFALIHPGPQKPVLHRGQYLRSLFEYLPELIRGMVCQHLNRSSPVLAILAVTQKDEIGWICYAAAIAQYLIIGLVASKDKAINVLTKLDLAIARQRAEIAEELCGPPVPTQISPTETESRAPGCPQHIPDQVPRN